jgi:A/G-specific adenine glycosylase
MMADASVIQKIQDELLAWYKKNKRDLPWRQTRDPYRITVSEIMLQQTQAPRVVPKYLDWLTRFPTVKDLALASPGEVIRHWQGLGYNRRALFLQRAATAVTELHEFPRSVDALQKLPGIGPYTAAAICSFAYNQDVALVDTNIKRFYQLIVFGDGVEPTVKEVDATALHFLPRGHSREWHNALMDIGTILSSCRGAKAQQEKLIALLPSIKSLDLPEVSDQPLKRPKQSIFKNSRRYWRGQIISNLRKQPAQKQTLIEELKSLSCTYDAIAILHELETDGLILIRPDGTITLPD